jgi:hypothetical protein
MSFKAYRWHFKQTSENNQIPRQTVFKNAMEEKIERASDYECPSMKSGAGVCALHAPFVNG